MKIQEAEFRVTFYALLLVGNDAVLSIQWLEILGLVVCDWRQLLMMFLWDNRVQILRGIQHHHPQLIHVKSVCKSRSSILFVVYHGEDNEGGRVTPYMQMLLHTC